MMKRLKCKGQVGKKMIHLVPSYLRPSSMVFHLFFWPYCSGAALKSRVQSSGFSGPAPACTRYQEDGSALRIFHTWWQQPPLCHFGLVESIWWHAMHLYTMTWISNYGLPDFMIWWPHSHIPKSRYYISTVWDDVTCLYNYSPTARTNTFWISNMRKTKFWL